MSRNENQSRVDLNGTRLLIYVLFVSGCIGAFMWAPVFVVATLGLVSILFFVYAIALTIMEYGSVQINIRVGSERIGRYFGLALAFMIATFLIMRFV